MTDYEKTIQQKENDVKFYERRLEMTNTPYNRNQVANAEKSLSWWRRQKEKHDNKQSER